jgi:hypothetical protein
MPSYSATLKRLTAENLALPITAPLLTEADLEPLPAPVATYLRRTGSVGKPRTRSFHLTMSGEFARSRKNPGQRMHYAAEQYSFLDTRTRLFFMRASLFGVPMDGLHVFTPAEGASMRIKLASLFQVVDAHGEKMNQGETVTYLNDMCILAPASLIDPCIRWDELDAHHVKATLTKDGVTVSAVLTFDEAGDLADFYSDDRFYNDDGVTYLSYRWKTPIAEYRTLPDGRRMASKGSAIWETPEGDFEYITFNLGDARYNVPSR